MGFNLKKGGNFTLAPAGTHPARCYMVLDLGTQPIEYQGKKKEPQQKIRLGFELPFEKHVFKEEKGEEPFTLSRAFTNTLADKGTLKPILNAWRGRPLDDIDIKGGERDGKVIKPFSFDRLLGAGALITVVHEPRKDGSMVAKIASIAKLPAVMGGHKIELPPAILKPILYSVDDGPDSPAFKELPEWIKEECQQCIEWTQAPEDNGEPGSAAPGEAAASAAGDDPF